MWLTAGYPPPIKNNSTRTPWEVNKSDKRFSDSTDPESAFSFPYVIGEKPNRPIILIIQRFIFEARGILRPAYFCYCSHNHNRLG